MDKVLSVQEQVKRACQENGYCINQTQMRKFIEAIKFILSNDGNVKPLKFIPEEESIGLSATFIVFDIFGNKIDDLCSFLRSCSAVSIDATTKQEVCISISVPNVFVRQ